MMVGLLKQSTAIKWLFFMADDSDSQSGKTGLNSFTVNYSKAGAALASISPTITERSLGWYELAITTTHTDTLGHLVFDIAHAGAVTKHLEFQVSANLLDDVDDNVTNVGDAVTDIPTNPMLDTAQIGIKKNVALAGYTFPMVDSSGDPATGLTVTPTRSIDGAAFGACANSVTEIGNGWYKIDLAAGDLNGRTIAFNMAAGGARTLQFSIDTQI